MTRRHDSSAEHRRDRGAGLIELALAVPVLISLLLGSITAALTLNDDLQLTHAVREGARHGATIPDSEVFASGTWAENVRNIVVERFGEGLEPSDVCVALVEGSPGVPLTSAHTTNSDGSACYDDSSSGATEARVQVTAHTPGAIDTGFYSHDVTLTSFATSKHESNG